MITKFLFPKFLMPRAPQKFHADVNAIFATFAKANPHPQTELAFTNEFTLLVAIVLSAQTTDVQVNKATAPLFAIADCPQKILALGEKKLLNYLRTIGLFRNKVKHVLALSQLLIERYGGQVPRTREELQALPGVGRKTANVWLNCARGMPTIAVDTHVFRVSNRLGLAKSDDVLKTELALEKIIPKRWKKDAHHWLILHGRYVCKARRPECERCIVARWCEHYCTSN